MLVFTSQSSNSIDDFHGLNSDKRVVAYRLYFLITNRARQLYKNISMLFLFPVTRDLLCTNV